MKRSVIIAAIGLLCMCQMSCSRRTPESLFKSHFNIDLSNFDYSVETLEDEWIGPDGHTLIILHFDILTKENIDYLMSKGLISLNENNEETGYKIPTSYMSKYQNGYYLYKSESPVNEDSYKLFIVDFDMKEAMLYYVLI